MPIPDVYGPGFLLNVCRQYRFCVFVIEGQLAGFVGGEAEGGGAVGVAAVGSSVVLPASGAGSSFFMSTHHVPPCRATYLALACSVGQRSRGRRSLPVLCWC